MIFKSHKLIAILMLLLSNSLTVAQEKKYLLSEGTYKSLTAAQELLVDEKYQQVEIQLSTLLNKVKDTDYEQAVILQTLGYVYSSQAKYKQATGYFEKALALSALPPKVEHNLRYNLAQLFLASEQYKLGIALLEKWLKAEASPKNDVYVLLASAYYGVKDYKKVVSNITIAINNDKSAKESWYKVLLSAHLELKNYKRAIKVLEKLISQYPHKKSYWSQLTALYLQQKKEFTALAVRTLAERLELGNAKTLFSLADMYRYLHIPLKSGQLLEQALENEVIEANFDNLNKLAESWLAAREGEKAALVLTRLMPLDKSGEIDLKLGRLYVTLEEWQQAIAPLSSSLEKLHELEQGQASLLLGMAYFYDGQLKQAEVMFSKAVGFKNQRNQAGQWLRHIANQKEQTTDAT